jgi:hypothetical protein
MSCLIFKENKSDRKAIISAFFIILAGFVDLSCQEPPPRPIRVEATAQILSFGAFYEGVSGGTVIIDPSGSRSSTGDVILLGLGYPFTPALFEIHAHPGTVISILNGPDAVLTGVPSGSMSLHIGNSLPASPFVSTVQYNIAIQLLIGGTLTVGSPSSNPPGNYTGTFEITLVRE